MRRRLVGLPIVLLLACAPADVAAPPSAIAEPAAMRAGVVSALPSPTITFDLTLPVASNATYGKFFRLGTTKAPSPYTKVFINPPGDYFATAPNVRLAQYQSKYYLVPWNAVFGADLYGYFCGAGWGWNANGGGNNSIAPLPDGGTDKACRTHDQGWSAPNGSKPSALSVRGSDKAFLAALKAVKPKWKYEADYVAAAIKWITCRVNANEGTTGDTAPSRCNTSAKISYAFTVAGGGTLQ